MSDSNLRTDGRGPGELRPLRFIPDFMDQAEGSVLVEMGRTRVICTATLEEGVPGWMRGSGRGWLTAEYAMLPRATRDRTDRESARGKIKGRTHEIQRLIGRSLRAVTDLDALGERTLKVDCDVIGADGGTRTASITGAWLATAMAFGRLLGTGPSDWSKGLSQPLAAISVGLVGPDVLLDLCYEEDSRADVDMNVVMTGDGRFVEVQGTAEGEPFSREDHDRLLALASAGIADLVGKQQETLERLDR